jgi:2-oxoglutarate dehydrogenase E2 component (dihydrolipoamide succinyltransferase)
MAIVDLVMPKLGESITEATILKWAKKIGDAVKQDETVLEIATDKVDSEVPSSHVGIITEILFNVNDVVPIGTVIARLQTDAGEVAVAAPAPPPIPVAEVIPTPLVASVEAITPPTPVTQEVPFVPTGVTAKVAGNNKFYSPLVLNIANSEGISLSELENIPGTGADGRVSKRDVIQYVADKRAGKIDTVVAQPIVNVQAVQQPVVAQPQPQFAAQPIVTAEVKQETPFQQSTASYGGNVEIIEMDRMRKMIAKHMVDSKHISPHVTSFAEADVTNMVLWRERIKKQFEKENNSKITFTPMFIECVTKVMKRFPFINASLDGDKIIVKKDFNIGMATALPSGNLIVPVIKGADMLNLVGLSKTVNNLANAARNNKLKPDDTAGGTFTITNVGTFGSLMGTPIINQPQVAILAVGAIKKRPVVVETPEGDTIGIRHMMYLSLSYDHRIVDGSIGASFLTAVAKEFEKWDINKEW